jgi:hypothetical protein
VHAFPSLHDVPFGFAGFEHTPVPVSQVPARWHWSGAGHTTGFAPTHEPPLQVSVCVQASPSSHGALLFTPHVPAPSHTSSVHGLPSALHPVPLGFGGFEHTPVPGLQVPTS